MRGREAGPVSELFGQIAGGKFLDLRPGEGRSGRAALGRGRQSWWLADGRHRDRRKRTLWFLESTDEWSLYGQSVAHQLWVRPGGDSNNSLRRSDCEFRRQFESLRNHRTNYESRWAQRRGRKRQPVRSAERRDHFRCKRKLFLQWLAGRRGLLGRGFAGELFILASHSVSRPPSVKSNRQFRWNNRQLSSQRNDIEKRSPSA